MAKLRGCAPNRAVTPGPHTLDRVRWAAPEQAPAARLTPTASVLALVDGLFEALGISPVVFGAVNTTHAEVLQHVAGARQLGPRNLNLLAPEARAHQGFGALRVNAIDRDDQHCSRQLAMN